MSGQPPSAPDPLAGGRSAVLVTGMSGTGKSTVLAELARRGHRVLDSDEPGWIIAGETAQGPEPLWDLDKIGALLDAHRRGCLFVAGCVANQGALYRRFDAVVLLSAPLEVILRRVANRANPFGSSAADRAKIAADLAEFEPLLRAGADHELLTSGDVGEIADALERIAQLSSSTVTGPSPVSSTSIIAPNTPRSAPSRAQNRS